jgi:hypothetical protein
MVAAEAVGVGGLVTHATSPKATFLSSQTTKAPVIAIFVDSFIAWEHICPSNF